MTAPSVSVVMPAYNAEKYLREAIDSILSQTYTDFEFIIINDGSTDATKEIIQSYTDPRIVYIENEVNSGICVTLNKGLDAARGKYIARMDSDDIALPNRLETQVRYMEAHPEIGVAGSDIEIFYENGEKSQIVNYDTDAESCKANLIFSATLAHPAAFIRTSVLNDHQLRYDSFFHGMEDHHLWWRIAKLSKITNIPKVLLRYRQHTSQITRQSSTPEFKERLRAFITQRVNDCGAILDSRETKAFCLYHEDIESFDKESLSYFISACRKLLKSIKHNKTAHYSAQKMVFSRAISFCIDRSRFGKKDAFKFQLSALMKNTMNTIWFSKRMAHLIIKKDTPVTCPKTVIQPEYPAKKRVAVLMYYMNCGGVESALVNLLNKVDYDKNIVDLYFVEAKGEFINRINKRVNIIDLSKVIHPVQKQLIISENIHETIRFAFRNAHFASSFKHIFSYLFNKISNAECPAYKSALLTRKIADFTYDAILDFHGYASFTTYFGAHILSGKQRFTWCHSQSIDFNKVAHFIRKYDKMYLVAAEMKALPSLKNIDIPIDVFYNFIDTGHILSSAKLGDKLVKSADFPSLLTIGRLSHQKGYDIAINAAKILKDKGLSFRWYFCGAGEDSEALTEQAKRCGLNEEIVFMGFQDNPYGYLSSCDIYVQPSRFEGYAVTLMEANVLKKVIVSTDVSGAKEAVRHGVDGFVCGIDHNEIASKLEVLLSDKSLLAKMEQNALDKAFSQEASDIQLKSIFD